MEDIFVKFLLDLYKAHGEQIFEDENLIRESAQKTFPDEKAKVRALVSALEEKLPLTLRESGSLTEEELNLVWKGFAESTGIREELAKWCVDVLNTVIKTIEEEPELRRLKKRLRAPQVFKAELKENLVKMDVLKPNREVVSYNFDGTVSLADFIEQYMGEGEEITLQINGDVELERPITFQGKKVVLHGTGKYTLLADILPAFEIVKGELFVDNLILKFAKEPERAMGLIFATDSSVEIQNSELIGAGIKLHSSKLNLTKTAIKNCKYLSIFGENSGAKLSNCELQENGVDIFSPQIRFKGGNLLLKNTKVLKGSGAGIWVDSCNLQIEKSQISDNYYYGIYVDANSEVIVNSSKISENGNSEEDYPQIKVISAKIFLKNTKILNGINNTGLWLEDRAHLEADDLKISGHYYHGLVLKSDSEALLRGGEVTRNGNEDEDRAQIYMESSKAFLKEFKIHNGVFNSGIVLEEGSTLDIYDSAIYRHFYNAVTVKSTSRALLVNCEIYENGSESFHAPQIWVTNGSLKVEGSIIRDGVKNDGILGRTSNIDLINVSIYNHSRRGVFVEANTSLSVSGSRIYSNNLGSDTEAQVELKSSNATFVECEVSESKNGSGIYVSDISNIVIRKSKITFNYGLGIWVSSNSSIEAEDTLVEGNNGKDGMFPQILVTSSKGKFYKTRVVRGTGVSGIVVERSFLQLVECVIENNENYGMYILSNSVVEGLLCEIRGNGNEAKDFPQVKVENSKFILRSSQVSSGINNTGISIVESSYAELDKSAVFNNAKHGIEVYYNSELSFTDGEIYGNGSEKESYAQLWVGSSFVRIKNSGIHDGKNNMGIGILKSYAEIDGCKIFGHSDSGLNASWYSGIKIKDSLIFSNALNQSTAQVVLISSRGAIRGCEIYGSPKGDGVRMEDLAVLEIDNSKIYENKGFAILCKDNSDLKMSGCEVYKNNEIYKQDSQIKIDNSRTTIKNCKITGGIEGSGVKIVSSPLTEFHHTVVAEHKGSGIEVLDNFSRLRMVGVNTYRNAQGGLVYKNPYKLSVIDSTFEDGSIRRS